MIPVETSPNKFRQITTERLCHAIERSQIQFLRWDHDRDQVSQRLERQYFIPTVTTMKSTGRLWKQMFLSQSGNHILDSQFCLPDSIFKLMADIISTAGMSSDHGHGPFRSFAWMIERCFIFFNPKVKTLLIVLHLHFSKISFFDDLHELHQKMKYTIQWQNFLTEMNNRFQIVVNVYRMIQYWKTNHWIRNVVLEAYSTLLRARCNTQFSPVDYSVRKCIMFLDCEAFSICRRSRTWLHGPWTTVWSRRVIFFGPLRLERPETDHGGHLGVWSHSPKPSA